MSWMREKKFNLLLFKNCFNCVTNYNFSVWYNRFLLFYVKIILRQKWTKRYIMSTFSSKSTFHTLLYRKTFFYTNAVNESIFGSIIYSLALIVEIFGIISIFKNNIKFFVIYLVLIVIQIALNMNGFGLSLILINIWRILLIIFMSIYFIYIHRTKENYNFVWNKHYLKLTFFSL